MPIPTKLFQQIPKLKRKQLALLDKIDGLETEINCLKINNDETQAKLKITAKIEAEQTLYGVITKLISIRNNVPQMTPDLKFKQAAAYENDLVKAEKDLVRANQSKEPAQILTLTNSIRRIKKLHQILLLGGEEELWYHTHLDLDTDFFE